MAQRLGHIEANEVHHHLTQPEVVLARTERPNRFANDEHGVHEAARDQPEGCRGLVHECGIVDTVGGLGNAIRLWDPNSGTEIAQPERSTDYVRALVVLPDGRLAGSSYKTIQVWDPNSDAETVRLVGHADGVNALALCPTAG